MVTGRKLRVWSDNTGAETSVAKGSSRAFDHTCLVHCMWVHAIRLGINIRVDRVPTHDNVADLPSREDYSLLESLGAKRVEAKLDAMYWKPEAWSSIDARRLVLSSTAVRGKKDGIKV